MRGRLAIALLVIVLPLLSACGPTLVHTDVTRFHDLPPTMAPHSFTILPDPGQVGSLEFQHYAELVAAELQARGWRPIPSTSSDAEMVASVHWGYQAPNTLIEQSPYPGSGVSAMGGFGRRHSFFGAGIGVPLGGYDYDTRVITTYPKWLQVTISDAAAQRRGERRILFEGRAATEDTSHEIASVMPYLVRGLFTGFPGANGTTVRVDVPVVPPPPPPAPPAAAPPPSAPAPAGPR